MKVYHYLAQLDSAKDLGIPDQDLNAASVSTFLSGIYFIAGFLAVLMIIIGSISFVTSSGDSSKATKARNTIIYATIGLVLVILAFAITSFVIGEATPVAETP